MLPHELTSSLHVTGTGALTVPGFLEQRVEAAWYGAPGDSTYEVLPDGCIDLVLQCQDDEARVDVHGSASRARSIHISPNAHFIGLRFRPGAWNVPGFEAGDLVDGARPFVESFRLAGGVLAAQALVEQLAARLHKRLSGLPELDPLATASAAQIRRLSGIVRIERLARECGVSRRTLERRFIAAVGLTPKHFAEIVQMQRVMESVRETRPESLADLALECGYSDHSHMTRQFRRLAGRPPSKICR